MVKETHARCKCPTTCRNDPWRNSVKSGSLDLARPRGVGLQYVQVAARIAGSVECLRAAVASGVVLPNPRGSHRWGGRNIGGRRAGRAVARLLLHIATACAADAGARARSATATEQVVLLRAAPDRSAQAIVAADRVARRRRAGPH